MPMNERDMEAMIYQEGSKKEEIFKSGINFDIMKGCTLDDVETPRFWIIDKRTDTRNLASEDYIGIDGLKKAEEEMMRLEEAASAPENKD